ncbi:MAG TPA: amino acid adenylation domain-containing protein, partial [Steroidobacteraceae bacterium]
EVLERQGDYWKQRLSGAPALLELPTDRSRPLQRSYQGSSITFVLPAEVSSRLRALSRQQDATLFMTLYAGLAILLSRLSGQKDIVIGTPVANRQRAETEGLIGFFVNTLALRVQLRDDASVGELLAQVREVMLGAYAHQDLPFEQVVEALRPPRTLSHSPVFQVMLVLQNTSNERLAMPGLVLDAEETPVSTAQFDLTVSLSDNGEQIVGGVNYSTELFDAQTLERWVGHFRTVLESMVQDAARLTGTITLLDAPERERLITGFNETGVEYRRDRFAHELVEEQAGAAPDAIAVVYEGLYLSYSELNRRANQLARYLVRQGIGPDQLVALCVERGLEMIVGLLGVMKAGGAYVPLDPSYPRERLQFMFEDAAPRVTLTQEKLRKELAPGMGRIVSLDGQWDEIAEQGSDNLPSAGIGLTARHLAYVIYTSGSTGRPKGVMVEHGNLAAFVVSRRVVYGKPSHFLLLSSVAFDSSVAGLFGTLTQGGKLSIASPEVARDPSRLFDDIHRQGVTDLLCVPSLYQSLLLFAETRRHSSERLRVIVAGEACGTSLVEGWRRTGFPAQLFNEYGPTEATVWATVFQCDAASTYATTVPIGRPVSNTRILILDEHRRPVPIGVSGEIYIGGAGIARGYLNRPSLTADRFVVDPFSTAPGGRLYKTGDVGRWRADGCIEFLGRNDNQVKIRGYRIELGEIESQLLQDERVKEAAVIALDEATSGKRLVAYYTAKRAGESPARDELRALLRSHLPEHMVPSAFVALETLPLTPNGKLDRAGLPAPDSQGLAFREEELPRGEVEETLASIWKALLHRQTVGRHDNFFDLGGHSLLAVQLTAAIERVFGREIPLRDVFTSPTIAGLASILRVAQRSVVPPIEIADRNAPLPLSFAQQRLWFIEQLPGSRAVYHMPTAIRLRGALDEGALRTALSGVVARHEALRTTFQQTSGEATQVICAPRELCLRRSDLSDREESARAMQLSLLLETEVNEPFDLRAGPLIRARLVKLGALEHVLSLTMHHIVSDGWSIGVLLQDLATLYAAAREGRSAQLPPLPIQYADYSVWQRKWLQGEVLQKQLNYWRAHLAGAPALLELPTDRARPAVQSYAGGNVTIVLGAQLAAALRLLAKQQDATLFMTLYAGFAILLSRLSGQSDTVIGVPVANRQRAELEGLIGFFVNTLALRVQVDEARSVATLIERVKEITLGGYAHQDTPFEQVVEALRPARSLSHNALFQVMFALQNVPQSSLHLPDLTLVPQAGGSGNTAQFDLSLVLQEVGDNIVGSFNYASDLFDATTIERWVGYYKTVLTEMARDATQIVQAVSLLSVSEQLEMLEAAERGRSIYPQHECIHEMFERVARKAPDTIAVCYEGQQLTYGGLNFKANQLARELRQHGVGPDALVAICVERGLEMI